MLVALLVNVRAFFGNNRRRQHIRGQFEASASVAWFDTLGDNLVSDGIFRRQTRHSREGYRLSTDGAITRRADRGKLRADRHHYANVVVISAALVGNLHSISGCFTHTHRVRVIGFLQQNGRNPHQASLAGRGDQFGTGPLC